MMRTRLLGAAWLAVACGAWVGYERNDPTIGLQAAVLMVLVAWETFRPRGTP